MSELSFVFLVRYEVFWIVYFFLLFILTFSYNDLCRKISARSLANGEVCVEGAWCWLRTGFGKFCVRGVEFVVLVELLKFNWVRRFVPGQKT